MATDVFGVPVLGGTRMERALEALSNPNAGNKRVAALDHVRQRKKHWGTGVSTLGIFYNATGETLIFNDEDSSYGHIDGSYPTRVENGQWGTFFHTKKTAQATGSVGFVVYRVRVDDTKFCNPLIAWSNPWSSSHNNQAYCDVFEDGKVDAPDMVYHKMDAIDQRQHVVFKLGLMVTSKIETGTSPVYEAEFTREDVAIRKKSADKQVVEEAAPST